MSDAVSEDWLSDAASVPVGPCPRCEREVIAYLVGVATDLETSASDGAAADRYACVHCDQPVRGVYLVDETELDRLGYAVDDPMRQGCGTGCAAGGCAVRRGAT